MDHSTAITEQAIWVALERVKDPEIPVLSLVDMAMISKVELNNDKCFIYFTPTFVGCPALDMMKRDIKTEVELLGIATEVVVDMNNTWSSDKMSTEAKTKLEKFGIAPPVTIDDSELTQEALDRVRCPHCHSTDTTLRSAFGSTLCRARANIRFCFACKQGCLSSLS
jgi:ring-1,2-phenylacetyl-CoA epoxidase subunit PaaD